MRHAFPVPGSEPRQPQDANQTPYCRVLPDEISDGTLMICPGADRTGSVPAFVTVFQCSAKVTFSCPALNGGYGARG